MAVIARGKKKTASKKSPARKSGTPVKPVGNPAKEVLARTLRQRLHLKQPEFARLLPVSVRSLATLESGTPPTDAVARRLIEFQRLAEALSEVIREESLGTWLQTPNDAFGRLKPIEVIERGEIDRLWSMIYFLQSGVPN